MQRRFKWLIAVVVLVCAGWTGIWFYAASYTEKAMDRWIDRQAAQGRKWTCAGRNISGYPFRMLIRCKSIAFEGPGRGGKIALSTGAVRIVAQIYNPKLILAEAEGPARIVLPSGARTIEANWSQLRASVRVARPVPQRLSVRMEKPQFEFETAGRRETLNMADAEFHLRPAPDVTAEFGATDLAVLVNKAVSSAANRITGDDAPVNLSIVTRVTRMPLLLAGPRNSRLEHWRSAGGDITVQNIKLIKNRLELDASGRLQLDDGRRLSGIMNIRAAGFGRILQRFGLPALPGGGLLGNLLNSRKEPTAGASGQAKKSGSKIFIPLKLRLHDGFVWIGPLRTNMRLKPLY